MSNTYLPSAVKQFAYYKDLAEKAIAQLKEDEIFLKRSKEENSISVIMKHIAGNLLSRWADIFNTDGEKEWRNRDEEFRDGFNNLEALLDYWEKGWAVLFQTLEHLEDADLEKIIYIRKMGHTITEAINRQLSHYPYHVGQIVLLAKQFRKDDWKSLSIPLDASVQYNAEKMSKGKRRSHFTEDL